MIIMNKWDLYLLFLLIITLVIWFTNNLLFSLIIYFLLFIYLLIKKRPLGHFFIIIMFSVMSINQGIFLTHYILVIFLFGIVILRCIKNREIYLGNLLVPLIVFLFYSALSILWTPIKATGFNGLVAMLEGYLVYFILTNGGFEIKKSDLPEISKIATYVMLTLTIEIFTIYFRFGFEKVINYKKLINLGWGYSNFIAVIFVLLLPIAFYKYLKQKKITYYLLFFDLLNLIGLLLTLSRGAIVGFLFAFSLFTILFLRKRFFVKLINFLYFSLILILLIYFFYKPLFYQMKKIVILFFTSKEMYDAPNRLPLYKVAVKSFLDKPIFGHGLKASKYLIYQHLDGRINAHFHNFILQIASTLGIVGLILFSFIVIKWLKILYLPKDKFVVCSTLSIIGALTHQLVDVSFDLFYFGIYFYGIFALVEVYRHSCYNDDITMRYVKRCGIIG